GGDVPLERAQGGLGAAPDRLRGERAGERDGEQPGAQRVDGGLAALEGDAVQVGRDAPVAPGELLARAVDRVLHRRDLRRAARSGRGDLHGARPRGRGRLRRDGRRRRGGDRHGGHRGRRAGRRRRRGGDRPGGRRGRRAGRRRRGDRRRGGRVLRRLPGGLLGPSDVVARTSPVRSVRDGAGQDGDGERRLQHRQGAPVAAPRDPASLAQKVRRRHVLGGTVEGEVGQGGPVDRILRRGGELVAGRGGELALEVGEQA